MRDGDRAVSGKQERRHGSADNIGTTDNNAFLARNGDLVMLEHLHNTRRSAREDISFIEAQMTCIELSEGVNVLLGRHSGNDTRLVDVLRQRKLNEQTVDRRIGIDLFDLCDNLFGRIRFGEDIAGGCKSDLLAGAELVAYINDGSGILANSDNAVPGLRPYFFSNSILFSVTSPRSFALTSLPSISIADIVFFLLGVFFFFGCILFVQHFAVGRYFALCGEQVRLLFRADGKRDQQDGSGDEAQ